MDEYAYVNGKKLRKGFTTGTCATAATVAALSMILNQEREEKGHCAYGFRRGSDHGCSQSFLWTRRSDSGH